MWTQTSTLCGLALVAMTSFATCAAAQNVKVTSLGSHTGELCNRDRALIFEDPTGVRLLYDAGQSVTGGEDARLGVIHVVLVSHAHGDHLGDQRLKALGAGTCQAPELASAAPATTTGEIAAAKNAGIAMINQMAQFVGKRVEAIKGKPTAACPQTGDEHVVPFAAPCLAGNNLGGARTFRTANATRGVEVTIVPASHDSSVSRALLSEPERKNLEADNMTLTLGPPSGYVIRFTNGLVAYLTGDTAIHADMKAVVQDFHKPNLMVQNLGTSAGTAASSAYIANELIRPATVLVTHVNEAATVDGKLRPQSRTAAFIALVKGRSVHLALSGRTMEFDGTAKCVAGCS
jgi:L-ascorbate metabolism protein UlaG (beta-lactamase superfamily)